MKHFLKLMDHTPEELKNLLDLAAKLKKEQKSGMEHKHLKGKTIGLLFEKASTRTRVSFEVGAVQLGMYPLFLSSKDLQIGRGEPVQDTIRVLSRYIDALMIRTYKDELLDDLAKYGSIPVINGLTDGAHPCQVMADLLTIQELKGKLEGLTFCYIGDGNNMANSLIVGCLKMGMKMNVATPKGYEPWAFAMDFAKQYPDHFMFTNTPKEAIASADVVCTDTWASMGMEAEEQERLKAFAGYTVDSKMMTLAKPDAIVLHCLPAYRGKEISEEVFEAHANEIFQEAENRLHVQKAIMLELMK